MGTDQDQSGPVGALNMGEAVPAALPLAAAAGPGRLPERPAPLSEGDFLLVRQAAAQHKTVKRAVRTARNSAVITLCIGILAVVLAVPFDSWPGAAVAAGVCVVGGVEYAGYRRLRQGDAAAARMLGANQVAFLGLIVTYCVVQMVTFSPEQARAAALSPEVRAQLAALPDMLRTIDAQIDRLAPLVVYGLYGATILLSGLVQGGLAMYYFARRRLLTAFYSQTPPWVRRLLGETDSDWR